MHACVDRRRRTTLLENDGTTTASTCNCSIDPSIDRWRHRPASQPNVSFSLFLSVSVHGSRIVAHISHMYSNSFLSLCRRSLIGMASLLAFCLDPSFLLANRESSQCSRVLYAKKISNMGVYVRTGVSCLLIIDLFVCRHADRADDYERFTRGASMQSFRSNDSAHYTVYGPAPLCSFVITSGRKLKDELNSSVRSFR